MTIILVTHEVDIAEYAQRVLMFRDGKIVRDYPVTARRDAGVALRELPREETETEDEG